MKHCTLKENFFHFDADKSNYNSNCTNKKEKNSIDQKLSI